MAVTFYQSTDVKDPLKVKINHMEGPRHTTPLSEVIENPVKSLSYSGSRLPVSLVVEAQAIANAKPLTITVQTTYKTPQSSQKWNQWLELPIEIRELPEQTYILFSIWGPSGQAEWDLYGISMLRIYEDSGALKQGRQKLPILTTSEIIDLKENLTDENESDRIEVLLKEHQKGRMKAVEWLDNLVFRRIEQLPRNSEHCLFIDMPLWDHDIVYTPAQYAPILPPVYSDTQQLSTSVAVLADVDDEVGEGGRSDDPIIAVYDPDFSQETPIEAKYRRMVRSSTGNDRDMRPNAKARDDLERIMAFSPVREPTSDEKNILWRYRYYLTKHKRALTKFVKCVAWDDPVEAAKAVEVLQLWVDIDVAEALELLGPEVTNSQVRVYAVDRLRKASDHELELFLLQLVEALKFEPWVQTPVKSYLARFLTNRAILNPILGNYFYWYVAVQSAERKYGSIIYQPVMRHYLAALASTDGVTRQVKLTNKLLELAKNVKQSKESRAKRTQQLRDWIDDPRNELLSFTPTILPLDPSITVDGIIADQCKVFKSSMLPLKIALRTTDGGTYSLIFKSGDDLRQDQLVMQIIQLMDQLLQNENLDLKLTPYRILATGPTDGAIQFIFNEPVGDVISQYHGILPFLRLRGADPSQPLGVRADVMDNFVRSTAGYAVITYILGVGDRHLDNLLIDHEGHFFHIDFGYILGQDPKPFPPMIKLPIQLIDGMGGIQHENYAKFCSYCFTAFTTLRKSSSLILALFNLMKESNIPNIALERDQAVHKVEERFCLDMTEAEAIMHFQNLINDSVNAFLPMVIDRLHSLAQYWRA